MKYSFGVSNNRRKLLQRNKQRSKKYKPYVGSSFSPAGLSKYKNVKMYSSSSVGSKSSLNGKKGIRGSNVDRKKKLKKVILIFVGVCFFLLCGGLVVLGLYLKNIQDSLPSPDELITRSSDQSTQILDRDGNVLYTIYGDENREFVSIEDVPEYTKWAVLAAEDIEFYQHKGLDYISIIQAFLQNLLNKSVVRGASTITQQLVKNTLLYDILGDEAYDRTYSRKIKEVLITIQVEQTFTKDEILQMYMNEIALGGVNYGFQAAAQSYFNKDVKDLTLAESALIAGLIQSPGVYSPLYGTDPEAAVDRQNYVLDQMLKHKDLTGVTEEEIEAARNEELVYSSAKIDIEAPHFVFYVKSILENEYGVDRVERGGLKVTTTLDSSLQAIAEEEVVTGVAKQQYHNVNNGAMVVINPKNGQILSMVGSVDYWNTDDPRVDGNVNITTQERQMGSSVKPFVYLNAFMKGYGPWLLTPDIDEISFGTYDPKDWDGKYYGLMTARRAVVLSRNVPAVYALQLGGIDSYIQLMQSLGVDISSKDSYGLSMALGSAEMKLVEFANAYAALANSGVQYELTSILKVETSDGEVLYQAEEQEGTRVIDEKEAYLVNWMTCDLQNYNDRSENAYFNINGNKLCGKTGTTDGPKDLVGVLYNQSIVVVAWNGNNNNEEMPNAWASSTALTVANSFLKRVISNYNEFNFNRPSGVLTTKVCLDTGTAAVDGVDCGATETSVYIEGAGPQLDSRTRIEVCAENGLVPANLSAAQKYGLTTTKTLISTKIENSLQQEAYEKYLTAIEGSTYIFSQPETGSCTLPLGTDNAPVIDMSTPASGAEAVQGGNVTVSGSVRYLESISTFNVKFDGENISGASLNADGTFSVTYTVPSSVSIGTHSFTVYVVDNYGKTASVSVSVQVVSPTISLTSPSSGDQASSFTLSATTNSSSVSSVSFVITTVGGASVDNVSASCTNNVCSTTWSGGTVGETYKISVSGGTGSITVKKV